MNLTTQTQMVAFDERLKHMATVNDIYLGWAGKLQMIVDGLCDGRMYRLLSWFGFLERKQDMLLRLLEHGKQWGCGDYSIDEEGRAHTVYEHWGKEIPDSIYMEVKTED